MRLLLADDKEERLGDMDWGKEEGISKVGLGEILVFEWCEEILALGLGLGLGLLDGWMDGRMDGWM